MVVVTLLLAASLLVTCDLLLPPEDGEGEYTDVIYEITGAKGSERVKTVTVYLKPDNLDKDALPGPNTYGVKKSAEQRAIERALTLEGARMSHDYFEAVFTADGTAIKRAVWEIGQPAGISGVARGAALTYATPGGTALGEANSSIIFVGRKTGKTLLGVGHLTHINNKILSTPIFVNDAAESVTFTVSALATWLGLDIEYATAPPYAPTSDPPYGPNTTRKDLATPLTGAGATFLTGYGGDHSVTAGNTKGELVHPRVAGAEFPLYYLPSMKAATAGAQYTVNALYMVGGLTAATTAPALAVDLTTAVRIWGNRTGLESYPLASASPNSVSATGTAVPVATDLKGGLQWIKRTPTFMVAGSTYEIIDTVHDKVTKILEDGTTLASYPAADAAFPAAGLPVTFQQSAAYQGKTSYGIFAITFQVPVYALSPIRANNAGELPPEKWWIRPDYNQYQYLLDNGADAGGMVLLGTDVAGGGGDWLWIYTTGIGFNNE